MSKKILKDQDNINKSVKSLFNKLHKFFLSKIFRKKYIREGSCKQCGRCCESIYVRHTSHIIKEVEEFERLKNQHFFYNWLEVVDKNETGLVFKCTKLDRETRQCTVHNQRATICRQYPLEEIFEMGGFISDDCGYRFIPLKSFEEVFEKIKKQNNLKI